MKKFPTEKFQTKYFETQIFQTKFWAKFLRHFEQNHRLLITQNYFTQKLFSRISGKKFSKKKTTNKQTNKFSLSMVSDGQIFRFLDFFVVQKTIGFSVFY